MNIALLTAVWKRPKLTRIVLSYFTRMTRFLGFHDVRRIAVYSGEDDWTQDEISDLGWHPVKFRNQPVSEKLNLGIREIDLRWDPDAVMVIDTDCLIPAEWFDQVGRSWKSGGEIFYLNGGAFVNLEAGHDEAGEAFYASPYKFGPGMTFDWDLVQAADLNVWPGDQDQNLNSLAIRNFQSQFGADVMPLDNPRSVGATPLEVKIGDGIHSWENVRRRVASARQESFAWSGSGAYDLYDTEAVESLWRLKHAPYKING